MFLQQKGQDLWLARAYWKTDPQLWKFLIIPQAWSLGVELTFYLLAPFLLRKARLAVIVCASSLTLTAIGWCLGLDQDPWTYRFFPFELSLFMLGALSERWLLPRTVDLPPLTVKLAPGLSFLLLLLWPTLPPAEPVNSIVLLTALLGLMPLLFRFQHGRRWDTALGDLSYPLYICHYSVIDAVDMAAGLSGGARLFWGVGLSLFSALLLDRAVSRPIETMRRRIRSASTAED